MESRPSLGGGGRSRLGKTPQVIWTQEAAITSENSLTNPYISPFLFDFVVRI